MDRISPEGSIEAYRTAYKDSEGIFSSCAKACGLPEAEFWTLLLIREGASSQSVISEQLFISKQTVHSACRHLCRRGWIRMETAETNLRTKRISLTEEGALFVREHIDSLLLLEERAWYSLEEEERILLTRLTRKYNERMRQELAKGRPPFSPSSPGSI